MILTKKILAEFLTLELVGEMFLVKALLLKMTLKQVDIKKMLLVANRQYQVGKHKEQIATTLKSKEENHRQVITLIKMLVSQQKSRLITWLKTDSSINAI